MASNFGGNLNRLVETNQCKVAVRPQNIKSAYNLLAIRRSR